MARLIWSPRAIRDLEEICDYICQTSESNARSFGVGVRSVVESIPDQPHLGAMVPEYERKDIRERQYHNHRVIYRLRGEDVEVVAIIHGARLLPRKLPG